jgi:hypothetical protein
MLKERGRRLVLLSSVLAVCCIIGLAGSAAYAAGEPSTTDVLKRLDDIEQRIAKIEKRLDALEKGDEVVTEPAESRSVIEIISPKDGDEVGMNVVVTGIVHVDNIEGKTPVVAVHPMLTNMLWIQPLPVSVEKTAEGYRFRMNAYCGAPNQGVGEQFELYALLARNGAFTEGDQIERLPAGVPASASVLVTRTK